MTSLPPNVTLVRVKDPEEMALRAADYFDALLVTRPEAVLALPTGHTPIPFYEELARRSQNGDMDMSDATVFCLDEFRGLAPDDSHSCFSYLQRRLTDHIQVGQLCAFDAAAPDPAAECRVYEAALLGLGGLDLAVLGIGRNGHLAMNEPGSPSDSRTRPVTLAEETRADQVWIFGELSHVPKEGLTIGLGTLMEAKAVLLLASGEEKAGILSTALTGPATDDVPASILQFHPNVTVVADEAAAAGLQGLTGTLDVAGL